MIDLSYRSTEKELLDKDDIPFADIRQNMKELNQVNKTLGGHAITIHGVKKLLSKKRDVSICEIGCGGGDNISAIDRWCRRNKLAASFIGIDIKQGCIDFAKENTRLTNAEWIVNDYAKINFAQKPDVIFSSLFCHHFTDEEIVAQLRWMKQNTTLGFFINDLHRHRLAYHFIKWATRIFSKSYLVKNDAPLSVARAFTKKDWLMLLHQAGVGRATIQWQWAFRYLITFKHAIGGE